MSVQNGQNEVVDIRLGRKSSLSGNLGVVKLDQKKRLTLPAKWRAAHDHPSYVYVARGELHMEGDEISKTLDVFVPVLVQERTEANRTALGPDGKKLTRTERAKLDWQISQTFHPVDVDAQGRLRIKDSLLAHAGLTEWVSATATGGRLVLRRGTSDGDVEEETAMDMDAERNIRDIMDM
jgi:DNA-binding transcriptional regulator/RsmH inhibitor MraZ